MNHPLDPGKFDPDSLSPADRLAHYVRLLHIKLIARDAGDTVEEDRILEIMNDLWYAAYNDKERARMELCGQIIYATRYPEKVADVPAYADVVHGNRALMTRSPPTQGVKPATGPVDSLRALFKRVRIG